MSSREEDFPESVKRNVAARVAYICSNPECNVLTIGPHTDPAKVNKVGVAAHIEGAKKGAARFNTLLTREEVRAADNAIWLCQTCGDLIDNDEVAFPLPTILMWKRLAEKAAEAKNGKPQERGNRIAFLEMVFENAYANLRMQGTPKQVIDNYDLSIDERANLWQRVYSHAGHATVHNPYLGTCYACEQQVPFVKLLMKQGDVWVPGFIQQQFGDATDTPKHWEVDICPACGSPEQWSYTLTKIQQKLLNDYVERIPKQRRYA